MGAEESIAPSPPIHATADSESTEDSPRRANMGRGEMTPSGVEAASKQELPSVTRMMMTVGYMACCK